MRGAPESARFYAAAAGIGTAFGSVGVAVPLQVNALGGTATLAGAVIALGTVSIALGALAAGVLSPRLGGGPRTLLLALVTSGAGGLVLAAASTIPEVAVAGGLVGSGIGLFWVASQMVLGRRAGDPGSEEGFAAHFAAYTFGGLAGGILTGAIVAAAERAGLQTSSGIRLSAIVGLGAVFGAVVLWRPLAVPVEIVRSGRIRVDPARHLAVQVPDLLLVTALALLLPLAPTVLARGFHLGPFVIGAVMSGVSLAKITGTFAARRLSRRRGNRRTILLLLAGGGGSCVLLCAAITASSFIFALLAAALLLAGAWPLVVDSAHARVPPDGRQGLAVVWNAREYGVIAAGTLGSGWLLQRFGTPTPLFALAAVFVAAATVCSAVLARRPVWRPASGI